MSDPNAVSWILLAAWPLLWIVLVWLDRRHGDTPLFLIYAYIAGLMINHWFGGLVHSLPWKPFADSANTVAGFEVTTLGLTFLVIGAALVPPRPRDPRRPRLAGRTHAKLDPAGQRMAYALLAIGLMSWIIEQTPLAALPSVTSIVSGGRQLLIAGICLQCWIAWNSGQMILFQRWIMLSFAFPFYTTIIQGFLGFGITFMLTILIFVGTFYKPRWHILVGALVGLYAGMSLYVSYVENRDKIRAAVWGGQDFGSRFEAVTTMLGEIGPFDFGNPRHLQLVDIRLNQNELVGTAIHYVPRFHEFANGETLYLALIALVPRAIWPDKPVTAGSMGIVSTYTGIGFSDGTSVGIGQPLEFYITFGTAGVIVGFFLLGYLLRYLDVRLSSAIRDQTWTEVGLWFGVGVAALQPIGQLLEISSSMAAAAIIGVVLKKYLPSDHVGPRSRDLPARPGRPR